MAQFANNNANDNDPTQGMIENLLSLYNEYCAFGKGASTHEGAVHGWEKFCEVFKRRKIVDEKLPRTDADLIFAKVKPRGSHTIVFQGFITCLNEVAKRKNVRF